MSVAVLGLFVSFSNTSSAAVVCGNPALSDINTTYVNCSSGPIVAQQPGGRFLKPGQEDCPAWFPYFGCYTMRAVGAFFYSIR